jgi:hypothetical protein
MTIDHMTFAYLAQDCGDSARSVGLAHRPRACTRARNDLEGAHMTRSPGVKTGGRQHPMEGFYFFPKSGFLNYIYKIFN